MNSGSIFPVGASLTSMALQVIVHPVSVVCIDRDIKPPGAGIDRCLLCYMNSGVGTCLDNYVCALLLHSYLAGNRISLQLGTNERDVDLVHTCCRDMEEEDY